MKSFDIHPLDTSLKDSIQQKIDNLNKPKGSLGRLEQLAMQICLIQQTLTPSLSHPCHLLLGGDHGIEREGVSVSPREVTWQQMLNFTHGGGGVNMFCRQHGFKLRIVDVGVDYDFSGVDGIIDRKIARGTRNFLHEPAMTDEEFDKAIQIGSDLVDDCVAEGCRILCIGEMGIANTSPSSIWLSVLGGLPLIDCIGAGAGLSAPGIRHKYEILSRSLRRWNEKCFLWNNLWNVEGGMRNEKCLFPKEALAVKKKISAAEYSHSTFHLPHSTKNLPPSSKTLLLSYFGGFEMISAIGAMLRAAESHLIILVDGFIMTACAMAAISLYPDSQDYMIFPHCSDEKAHRMMLDILDARPLLSLGLRLGEGTGALCAFPIIDSAVRMINEMNNFDNAKITKYF